MRATSYQSGFAVLETVLILVVLVALGGMGYYAYQANNKANDAYDAASRASGMVVKEPTTSKSSGPEVIAYAKLPADAKQAIFNAAKDAVIGDDCLNGVTIDTYSAVKQVTYDADGYMMANVGGCDSGASNLFVKQKDGWKDVAQTQEAFDCDTLSQYKVPKDFLALKVGLPDENNPYSCEADNGISTYQG
jgi:hypothetical protein